jgi:lipopolysaccharide export system protein LptA
MRRLLAVALAVLGSLAFAPRALQAQQERECNVELAGVRARGQITTTTNIIRQPSGRNNVWMGGGVDAVCAGTDQRLLSDSLEQYPDQSLVILIGHVHYIENRIKLDSDRLTYYTNEERIVVEGNVIGTTPGGTRFTAPRAEYLRPAIGIRERSRLTAGTRATVWLSPKDAGESSKDTVVMNADRIISDNDSLVYANGKVVIERPDIVATSDSAFMDNGKEFMQLTMLPVITGVGERTFTLVGEFIDAWSKQKKLTRVLARGSARATSEEVIVSADSIDLRLKEQKIDHAYAWGPLRARAKSTDRDIVADSLDIAMPDQELKEVRAVRKAYAESPPDSTKIVVTEPDWIRGDTIIARFERIPAVAPDTGMRNVVHEIVSHGEALSYYQVAQSGVKDKPLPPNVNYVGGRIITLSFAQGKVKDVHVKDQAIGAYAEVKPDTATAKSDSTATAAKKKPATPPPAPKKP